MPTQSFLPVLDVKRKQILGMIAISSTNFAGNEVSFTIASKQYPISKYTPYVSPSRPTRFPWYMAFTESEVLMKKKNYASVPGWIPIADVMGNAWWTSTSIGAYKHEQFGALIDGLITGFGSTLDITGPADPVVGDNSVDYVWVASIPFANQPQQTFFDINWVEGVQLLNNEGAPAFLVIDSVTPNTKIKALVLTTGQPALNRATFNTIRLIRVPGQVLNAGDTVAVAATIHGQDGFTATITINGTIA